MTIKSNPAYRALWALMDLARGTHKANNAWLYALTWLAAARLAISGQDPEIIEIGDLISESTWNKLPEELIPAEAKDLVWGVGRGHSQDSSIRTQALGIVAGLIAEYGQNEWDVIDASWSLPEIWRADSNADAALAPELCELAFACLQAPPESVIWIPFDSSGQLVVRAIRNGLKVIAAGPGRRTDTHLRLLMAIEGFGLRKDCPVQFDVPRGNVKREIKAEFLIATPPFGMRLQTGAGWRQWEGDESDLVLQSSLYRRHGPVTQVQIDRSDSWAVAAFWPRVSRRAVFLASSGILFSKGQEQRLREHLLLESRSLLAAVLLPTRMLSVTTLASAMLILDRSGEPHSMRLVDATEMTIDTKSSMRYARNLDHERVASLVNKQAADEKAVCDVSIEEILKQDFSLMPGRYLRPALSTAAGPRRPLGDLVEVIRAPAASKESIAIMVQEAGFPELDRWRAVTGPCSKTTLLQPRKIGNHQLRSGDILLSIKGTLGKSGLIGDVPGNADVSFGLEDKAENSDNSDISSLPLVPSQSCIALRVRNASISPTVLLLYFRSDDFKRQIESLRSGAAIAHVTPATLLQDIHVPIPPKAEEAEYLRRWSELCELEASIEEAQERSNRIRAALWPTL